jgi:ketol-acid reductoisomerase
MATLFFDDDVRTHELQEKTLCIIGYGSQGSAQANNLRDSGFRVIVGLRPEGTSWKTAEQDGFSVFPIEEAVQWADLIHMLIPDETQESVYYEKVHEQLKPGSTLSFSSGFAIHFQNARAHAPRPRP